MVLLEPRRSTCLDIYRVFMYLKGFTFLKVEVLRENDHEIKE